MTSNCRHLALTVWQYNLLPSACWPTSGVRQECFIHTAAPAPGKLCIPSLVCVRVNHEWIWGIMIPLCDRLTVWQRDWERLTVVVRVAMWHLPGWRDSHRVALSSTTSVDTLGHAPGLWEAVKWSDKSNMNNLKQLLRPDSIVNNNNNNNDTVSQILNKRKGRLQTLRLSVAECSRHHNPAEIFLLFKFCSTKSNWIQF